MAMHQVEWSPEERASLDAFVKQVPPITNCLLPHTTTTHRLPVPPATHHLPTTSPLYYRGSLLPVGVKVVSPGPSYILSGGGTWNLVPGAWCLVQVQHMNDMRLEAVKQRAGAGGPNATQNVRREAEAGRLPGGPGLVTCHVCDV